MAVLKLELDRVCRFSHSIAGARIVHTASGTEPVLRSYTTLHGAFSSPIQSDGSQHWVSLAEACCLVPDSSVRVTEGIGSTSGVLQFRSASAPCCMTETIVGLSLFRSEFTE